METGYIKTFRLGWSAVLLLNFKMASSNCTIIIANRRVEKLEVIKGMYIGMPHFVEETVNLTRK